MAATVLSVASRAVLDACGRLGLDPDALLSAAGLSRAEVYDPDARLAAEQADALWRHAHAAAGTPDLALRAASALEFGAYKVLDFVVANAPTVGAGLQRVARYFPLVDARGIIEIAEGDAIEVTMSTAHGEVPPPAQEYTFAAVVLRSRASTRQAWRPASVRFTFDRPNRTSLHEEVFDCPIEFARPRPQLVIPREVWSCPVQGANEALFAVLEDHAQRLVAEVPREPSFLDAIKTQLRTQLRGGDMGITAVARASGMSERTLQRRLEELGLSFSDVLGEVRHELGCEYLREPDVSIAEVAWLLGFSDQSAFGRAFKRWTGKPPGAWRAAHA